MAVAVTCETLALKTIGRLKTCRQSVTAPRLCQNTAQTQTQNISWSNQAKTRGRRPLALEVNKTDPTGEKTAVTPTLAATI